MKTAFSALSLFAALSISSTTGCSSSEGDEPTASSGAALEAGCQAYAQAEIAKGAQCPLSVDELQIDDEVVSRLARTCVSLFSAPGSGATREKLTACADATAAASCFDYHGGIEACEPLFRGTIAPLEECIFDSQCQTGKCLGSTGASCGTCAWEASVGETCGLGSDQVMCKPELVCLQSSGYSGTCEKVAATELKEPQVGDSCDPAVGCNHRGLTCVSGTCHLTNTFCMSSSDCRSGWECDDTQHECKRSVLVGVGALCGLQKDPQTGDYETFVCQPGLYCDSVSDTCRSKIQEHGPCSSWSSGAPCATGLSCIEGRCIVPEIEEYSCGGDAPKTGFSF